MTSCKQYRTPHVLCTVVVLFLDGGVVVVGSCSYFGKSCGRLLALFFGDRLCTYVFVGSVYVCVWL